MQVIGCTVYGCPIRPKLAHIIIRNQLNGFFSLAVSRTSRPSLE